MIPSAHKYLLDELKNDSTFILHHQHPLERNSLWISITWALLTITGSCTSR